MLFKKILGWLVLFLLLVVLGGLIISKQLFLQEPVPSPSPSVSESPSPTPSPTPTQTPTPTLSVYQDKPDIDISSWEYTLVNKENLLASDFMPELMAVADGQRLDSRASEAFKEFVSAAKAEGLTVYITSAYRSFDTQEYLFNKKVTEYLVSEGSQEAAVKKAKTIVAYPGTSEHQLGLACDIVDKYYEYMNESLADTPLSIWMEANCAKYGFIQRYPEGKSDITGVMFEPWHYRYVGKEAAAYIMEKGLTLEEFVALYK